MMIKIKLKRIIFFYLFIMLIVFGFYILFIQLLSYYFISTISDITNKINNITINEENNILSKDIEILPVNTEMVILNNIYELQINCRRIMEICESETLLKRNKIELRKLLYNIKNKNIIKICKSIFGIIHYNNKIYNLAEKEFKTTIIFIEKYEKELQIDGKDVNDKLKDAIKRSTIVLYLNEYSTFEKTDENIRNIIYLNIYKQRFSYLYAMTKYNLANELYNEKNVKKLREKQNKYFREAIVYFNKCKDINKLLGINQIKIIYCLIMISKCYLNLKDYKNSIININEALYSYYNFSNIFSDNNSNKYNPKILLFVETNIFQYILFIFSNICSSFHKPFASIWITLNIFNTSPFILSNIHCQAGTTFVKFLEKYKNLINKKKNNIFQYSKNYNRFKKYYIKVISRLYEKNLIDNKLNEITSKKGDKQSRKSINIQTTNDDISYKIKSTLYSAISKKIFNNKHLGLRKNITICLNENITEKIKWDEFKHILIKFVKKYFTNNENDKFGFIHFGTNGLITKSFLLRPLNQFISKLYKMRNSSEPANDSIKNKINKMQINKGMQEIFDLIIDSYPKNEEFDNIIMLFMDIKDIRFSSIVDCVNIVETLNESNTSVFFFSFNDIIENDKINRIQSFLTGLIEGYLFQMKNYQQLKEIFINLSTNNFETNICKYFYKCFDTNL